MLVAGDFGDTLFDAFGDNMLIGGAGNDVLTVMSGTNELLGHEGADLLVGGIGSDSLRGGSGTDVLVADTSASYVGNDTLEGGSGDDLLQGGGGSDTFVFRTLAGNDTIATLAVDQDNLLASTAVAADFESGIDTISLIGFGYTGTAEVAANLTDINGTAVFSDQGTSITFYGLTVADLSADDFVFA